MYKPSYQAFAGQFFYLQLNPVHSQERCLQYLLKQLQLYRLL